MASTPETSVYGCGLGFMHGRQVYYAGQSEATNSLSDKFAFTNKCAFAVLLVGQRVDAVCFPCVKNAGMLWDFVADHNVRLHSILEQLAMEWIEFRTPSGEPWFFNLCGYYRFTDSVGLHAV